MDTCDSPASCLPPGWVGLRSEENTIENTQHGGRETSTLNWGPVHYGRCDEGPQTEQLTLRSLFLHSSGGQKSRSGVVSSEASLLGGWTDGGLLTVSSRGLSSASLCPRGLFFIGAPVIFD